MNSHRVVLSVLASSVVALGLVAGASAPALALSTNSSITSTVPVGSGVYAIGVDTQNGTSYVVNHDSNSVSVIEGRNLVATVAVGRHPLAVGVTNAEIPTAYVTNYDDNSVSVIQSGRLAGTIAVGLHPTAVAVDSVEHTVYVINSGSNSVSIIRGVRVVTTLAVGASPFGVAVNATTHTAYVSNFDAMSVSVIHADALLPAVVVPLGSGPIAVDSVSGIVYVVNSSNDLVSVIDGSAPVAAVAVGRSPSALAIDEVSHEVFVANVGSDDVSVLQGSALKTTVNLGHPRPSGVAVDNVTHTVYVGNQDATVSVIDDDALHMTIGAAGAPIAVNPTTHMVYATQAGANSIALIGKHADSPVVDRIDGTDRYAVATAMSQQAFPAGAPVAFIASGANYPDALSAGPAAVHLHGPVLLTQPDSLPAAVAAELARLHPATTYIVGGPNSVSPAAEAQIAAATGTTVKRVGGADRYEVSRNIETTFFGTLVHSAYVATGTNFPDALGASGAGGHLDSPILLVNGLQNDLDAATREFLGNLRAQEFTIAGGPNSVSTGIEASLAALPGTSVSRQAGADRYAASVNINLDAYNGWSDRVFLATGANFPDALAGSAWAGAIGAPLFVVPGNCVPQAVLDSLTTLNVSHVTLLGGPNSLSDRVADLASCGLGTTTG
jgi:YVTN family beta-propeller protein